MENLENIDIVELTMEESRITEGGGPGWGTLGEIVGTIWNIASGLSESYANGMPAGCGPR